MFGALREALEKLAQAAQTRAAASPAGGIRLQRADGSGRRRGGGAQRPPFGNVAENGRTPDAAAPRQPIVDLHADGPDIVVIAELPGVAEADMAVALDDGALLITAAGWRKRLALPAPVRPDSLRRSCRNGILEVRLARREEPAT